MHKEIRLDCIKNSNMRLKHRPLISRLNYNWFKIDSFRDNSLSHIYILNFSQNPPHNFYFWQWWPPL